MAHTLLLRMQVTLVVGVRHDFDRYVLGDFEPVGLEAYPLDGIVREQPHFRHAQQAEFPHCIPDGIFVLHEEGVKNGDDIKPIIGADDHVVEFEITPNRPDCLSVIHR